MPLHAAVANNTEEVLSVYRRGYQANGTRRPCIWLHSAGAGNVSTEPWVASNNTLPHLSALAETLHMPIIAPAMGGTTWGNDTAQTKITDALAYLRTTKGAHASLKPILVGVSMGGLTALNWARANPTLVQAIALFYPATNLQACHDGTGGAGDGHVAIEAAYGGLSAFNAAVAAHDPAQHATDYQAFPIKMWYSTADTTVGSANQTSFATAVGGSNFTSRSLGAVSHADMTQIDQGELESFLRSYA